MPHMTQQAMDLAVDAIAREFVSRYVPQEAIGINAYETAANRYELATDAYPVLTMIGERITEMANELVEAATANLRQYESQPGIPLEQYR